MPLTDSKRVPSAAAEQHTAPPTAAHFSHINRYWDREHESFAARLLPGEYYVTTAGEAICTVLGSCVSACVRDRRLGIGGMNHFMLPLDATLGTSSWGAAVSAATRYGNVAMERLVNDIMKLGGRREHLEVKLVGGGTVLGDTRTGVGARNVSFVRQYVCDEGFEISGEDLGDIYPRRVLYFPNTGKLRVKKLASIRNDTLFERERHYLMSIDEQATGGGVELF